MAFLITKRGVGTLTYGQLRGLPAPSRGIRCLPVESSYLDLLHALTLVLPDGAAYSHDTAAILLGLPIDHPMTAHVTVPRGALRRSRKAITWHSGDISAATIEVQGLPCTDPLRTWLDLGGSLALPELVAVTDVAVRRGMLRANQLDVPVGRRGAVTLRQAALLADARSLSPRESVVRTHLHLAGLPRPEINFDIIMDGGWIACADFAWPAYRLIVEYDGAHHDAGRQRHQDAQTRNELAARGWQVRVLTDWHFRHIDMAVRMIAEALAAQGWRV